MNSANPIDIPQAVRVIEQLPAPDREVVLEPKLDRAQQPNVAVSIAK